MTPCSLGTFPAILEADPNGANRRDKFVALMTARNIDFYQCIDLVLTEDIFCSGKGKENAANINLT
jgi:hypothetical protein